MEQAIATATGIEAEILRLEQERIRALVAVDLPALNAMMADDLVHIHSTGLVHDKTALINHIDTGRAFRAIERGQLSIRVMDDMAIMHGPMTNHMVVGGEPRLMEGMVTQILRRENGNWRFTHFQLTLFP
ncbi:nuclear transport factor 2 family protein [Sphingobium sp. MK2]|uniref:nuclear transport factor 2 family protein n=1 Tax=Sphingobium sp. MK2 TaxID=3116540 RepID=UPI0032E35F3A